LTASPDRLESPILADSVAKGFRHCVEQYCCENERNQYCFKHSHLSIQLLHIVIRDHLRIELRSTIGYR